MGREIGPWWMALLGASVGVLAGCAGASGDGAATPRGNAAEPADEDVIAVQVAPVSREPVSAIYSTSTTLRADRRATVIARTSGVTRRLSVEEGDRVDDGQVLARLEDDEQRIEFERTRAALDIEQKEFARARQLYDGGMVSHEAYETALRELEEIKHAFARAELELQRTVIRAPFAGQILVRHLDAGSTVSYGTAVYDLADLHPLYADVDIPERHIGGLAPGQNVRLVADASGERAAATIERIAPSVDPSTGTVKVTLAVEGGRRLRPGAFVRADILLETHDRALVVPRSALVAEGRRWHLFRLGPEGDRVSQIEVVLGFEEGDRVEIASVVAPDATLEAGDRVVVVGAPALSDGAAVAVVAEPADGAASSDGNHETGPA